MPRWYVSALLVGIVTVCAVCLGLRWRVVALSAPPDIAAPAAAAGPLLLSRGGAADPPPSAVPAGADTPDAGSVAADAVPWGEAPAQAADPPAVGAAQNAATPPPALASADPPPVPRESHPAKPPPTPVNINTATLAQLQALPGVGAVMAQRILDYRSQHGPFKTVEQLQDVKGIGPKKFAKLAPWAHV
jgi:competence protein ComEA